LSKITGANISAAAKANILSENAQRLLKV
jgi:hypothetical protein